MGYLEGSESATVQSISVALFHKNAEGGTLTLMDSRGAGVVHSLRSRGIERYFDVSFVANLALREKQVQQNVRPVIAVHKWFARRPGTLFRALLLSEFVGGSLRENFFRSHNLRGLRIADPFMGGGTPLLEANRLGCDVVGSDINPMAYWIVRQEIQQLDLRTYREIASDLGMRLEKMVGRLYRTECLKCKTTQALVKYFIWVKTNRCSSCAREFDLFPGYLLADDNRHTENVLICATCGNLNEVVNRRFPGDCRVCGTKLRLDGPARRNRCSCPHCGQINSYPAVASGPPRHRMVAIEYHCPICKPNHRGRFFKKPDESDLAKFAEAAEMWRQMQPIYVPDDEIPGGDESDRLHRWGYRRYREMFNDRQLLGLELLSRAVAECSDERVKDALATNLSDLLRYQNMLCRYDTSALKSLDIFSVHGFPVGLLQCESNVLGISGGDGANVGSGGWSNIVEKFSRAKRYCDRPFEVVYQGDRKEVVWTDGEWIGDRSHDLHNRESREVDLKCSSSTIIDLPRASLDAVLTDPPYFANVQYAELMDFCYVWLRRLVGQKDAAFAMPSTRHEAELTGNATMERGLDHFTEGLSQVFRRMAVALKPGAPFVFTFHHNRLHAYYSLAVALLDAGLVCTVSIPCPGEMAASIHINGTCSSVVDTVFVCRTTGSTPRRLLVATPGEIAEIVAEDMEQLRAGGLKPTQGDVRCVIFGHLIRLVVWNLRHVWNQEIPCADKVKRVADAVQRLGGLSDIENHLPEDLTSVSVRRAVIRESVVPYGDERDEVSF